MIAKAAALLARADDVVEEAYFRVCEGFRMPAA
jgi:hypothetical protein